LRHFLIVKKNSKGKGKKCKKEKAALKKNKSKRQRGAQKKGKAAPEKTIQKCSHPLYSFAELYCCLLELGPGRV